MARLLPTRAQLRFVRALAATSFKTALATRGAFFLQMAFMALNNLIFFVFWWVLFERVPTIRGYVLADVAVLFGIVSAGFGLAMTFGGGVLQLARLIDDGGLDAMLTQPKPTLLYALGSRSLASGLGDIVSGLALIALSGGVGATSIPVLMLAIASSALVVLASATVFFSLGFWLGRAETAARQLFDALITFSVYPEPLFGGALRLLLFSALPAGFIGHLPARVVREPSLAGALSLLPCAAGYVAFAAWIFSRGLRRYCSGSRFGTFG